MKGGWNGTPPAGLVQCQGPDDAAALFARDANCCVACGDLLTERGFTHVAHVGIMSVLLCRPCMGKPAGRGWNQLDDASAAWVASCLLSAGDTNRELAVGRSSTGLLVVMYVEPAASELFFRLVASCRDGRPDALPI